MQISLSPAILARRRSGVTICIQNEALSYLYKSAALSDGAKLLWICLTKHTALDPQRTCTLTPAQMGKRMGNQSHSAIDQSLKLLVKHQFLRITQQEGTTYYSVQLPPEGMALLAGLPLMKLRSPAVTMLAEHCRGID